MKSTTPSFNQTSAMIEEEERHRYSGEKGALLVQGHGLNGGQSPGQFHDSNTNGRSHSGANICKRKIQPPEVRIDKNITISLSPNQYDQVQEMFHKSTTLAPEVNLAGNLCSLVEDKDMCDWIVDTGATNHIVCSSNLFSESTKPKDHWEDVNSSGASTLRGDVNPTPFGEFFNFLKVNHFSRKSSRDFGDKSEGKQGISKIITIKAGAWLSKNSLSWPWKGNEREASEPRTTRSV
ncbi:hypothetical protein BC332_32804 [Capsicum chinense]|nr:hypothetical protein BC332_32804 [Capsicum chinense]